MSYSSQSAFLSNLIYSSTRVNQDAVNARVHYVAPSGAVWEIKAYDKNDKG